jgi:hypothetical protein
LGEFQPRSHRKAVGDPIPNYFPPAVTEGQWVAARAGAGRAGHLRGRNGSFIDIFRGLVRSATDGSTYFNDVVPGPDGHRRILRNLSGAEGRGKIVSFPADTFEWAVLSRLRELKVADVFPEDDAGDEVAAVSAELASVVAELAEANAFMDANGFSPSIGRRVQHLEDRQDDLSRRLDDARQRVASPASEVFGEAVGLIDRLKNSTDPTGDRLRLRAALRRLVETIVLLVVPHKLTRVAVAQVRFYGGSHRDYLIIHKHGRNGRSKRAPVRKVRDFVSPGRKGELDLRDPTHVAELEKALNELDLGAAVADPEPTTKLAKPKRRRS